MVFLFNKFTLTTWMLLLFLLNILQTPLWYPSLSSNELYFIITLALESSSATINILSTKVLFSLSILNSITIGSSILEFLSIFITYPLLKSNSPWFTISSETP